MSTDCGEFRGSAKVERLRGKALPEDLKGTAANNEFLSGRVVAVCRVPREDWTTVEAEIRTTVEGENWELVP